MAGPRSLHQLVEDALERAAQVHEDSYDLAERQRVVNAAVDETLRCVREDRERRRRSETDIALPGVAHARGRRNRQ